MWITKLDKVVTSTVIQFSAASHIITQTEFIMKKKRFILTRGFSSIIKGAHNGYDLADGVPLKGTSWWQAGGTL